MVVLIKHGCPSYYKKTANFTLYKYIGPNKIVLLKYKMPSSSPEEMSCRHRWQCHFVVWSLCIINDYTLFGAWCFRSSAKWLKEPNDASIFRASCQAALIPPFELRWFILWYCCHRVLLVLQIYFIVYFYNILTNDLASKGAACRRANLPSIHNDI
jgi:hypothetical protein